MANFRNTTVPSLDVVQADFGRRPYFPPPRLSLTVVEAANAIGISRRQIYVELQSRRLGSIKVGKRRLNPGR